MNNMETREVKRALTVVKTERPVGSVSPCTYYLKIYFILRI